MTSWVTIERSIMPFPSVLATCVPSTKAATKLKKAAQRTAFWGDRTRVETTVAMEFAASWKPLRKSKKSATEMMRTRTQMSAGMGRPSGGGPPSHSRVTAPFQACCIAVNKRAVRRSARLVRRERSFRAGSGRYRGEASSTRVRHGAAMPASGAGTGYNGTVLSTQASRRRAATRGGVL